VTYFNPVVSGTDFCRIERKKVAVFNSENGFSHKDLHDMSNFEILRGGFADYF